MNRRSFIRSTVVAVMAASLPISMVESGPGVVPLSDEWAAKFMQMMEDFASQAPMDPYRLAAYMVEPGTTAQEFVSRLMRPYVDESQEHQI